MERKVILDKVKDLGLRAREPLGESLMIYSMASGTLNIIYGYYIWLIASGAALTASAALAIWTEKKPVE